MGEFEDKVRRYWPEGDPLHQAHAYLQSEQMDVALRLCRMYLVDKTAMDDAQHRREVAYHAAMAEQRALEQQAEQHMATALDLIRRLYGSFRWEANSEPQVQACKDAETFLDLPAKERREWD